MGNGHKAVDRQNYTLLVAKIEVPQRRRRSRAPLLEAVRQRAARQSSLGDAGSDGGRSIRRGACGRSGPCEVALRRGGHQQPSLCQPHRDAVHGFDMLEHLVGPIESVMAQMADRTGTHPTVSSRCALSMAPSAVWSAAVPSRYLRARGERDTRPAGVPRCRAPLRVPSAGARLERSGGGLLQRPPPRVPSHPGPFTSTRSWRRFVGGVDLPVHARAGRRALALAHRIIDSFESATELRWRQKRGNGFHDRVADGIGLLIGTRAGMPGAIRGRGGSGE